MRAANRAAVWILALFALGWSAVLGRVILEHAFFAWPILLLASAIAALVAAVRIFAIERGEAGKRDLVIAGLLIGPVLFFGVPAGLSLWVAVVFGKAGLRASQSTGDAE